VIFGTSHFQKDVLAELTKTRINPLGINIKEGIIRRKTPYNEKSTPYFQLYLYTLDKERRNNLRGDKKYTKICVRSLRK